MRRAFSPGKWLRSTKGLQQLAEGGNGQEWILAREFCSFTLLDGEAIPVRKRKGFVDMAIARWSPFADTQAHVEWSGDRAMVWAWSKSLALTGPDETPFAQPRRIVPESLYRGQPMIEGEELLILDEGIEGRAWRNGLMVASRWWPALPVLPDWNEFRRGAGLVPSASLPEPVEHRIAEQTWAARRAEGLEEAFGRYRNYVLMAGVGIAAMVTSALLVGVLALKISIWQVDKQIDEREQALDKIIAARDRAMEASRAIDEALELRPPAGQVELLALTSSLMRGNWQLVEWRMADTQNLQVTARMANPDPRAIVTAWEASKRFADVTAELGQKRDTVVIKARILRLARQDAKK